MLVYRPTLLISAIKFMQVYMNSSRDFRPDDGTTFFGARLSKSKTSRQLTVDTGTIRQQNPGERCLSSPAEGRECWSRGLERFHASGCPDDLCRPGAESAATC